jgi:hypothetical protein
VTGLPSGGVPERLPGKVAPLFPLPNVWLFPAVILPLHVFEERYRRMIEDSLDGPGRLVLGTIQDGHEGDAAGAPPIHPLAGLGEIGRHERLPDGRFQILLVGLYRVFVRELPSEHPYRLVEYHRAEETPIAKAHEPELRRRLTAALEERLEQAPKIPPELSTAHLADMLALRLALEHAEMNALFSELDAGRRARAVLDEHERRPRSVG